MGCSFLAPVQRAFGDVADVVAPIVAAIPGPWQVPAMVYLAVDTVNSGGSLEDVAKRVGTAYVAGEIGAGVGSAVGGASSGFATALAEAGVPAAVTSALPSMATLASNAAVNVAMQLATTGKVDLTATAKSLAIGSVSNAFGSQISSGIDDKLLNSIVSSAAKGAMGAAISGKNPVTSALASALAGGIGYATKDYGVPQSLVNTTINALASGQSVQNALVSAALSSGGGMVKDYVKGFFDDVGVANGLQKGEGAQSFDGLYNAETEKLNYLNVNLDQLNTDRATLDANKDLLADYQQKYNTYKTLDDRYQTLITPEKYAVTLATDYKIDPVTGDVFNYAWEMPLPDGTVIHPEEKKIVYTKAEFDAMRNRQIPDLVRDLNAAGSVVTDLYTNGGVAPLLDTVNRVNAVSAGYENLSTAAVDARTKFDTFLPPEKTGDFLSTYTPAPDQGGVPEAPPVEVPPEEPVGCQPPFVDDGTGRCILPEDKAAEDKPTPDCGPGMAFSLATNSCVPIDDMTKPVTTTVAPKTTGSTGTTGGTGTAGVPTTPPVTAPNTAVNSGQTQQNQQNALLMGLLLGEGQQAPQQQQQPVLAKIDPYDPKKDILGAAEYEKATQQPYAAGGSVHAINDELIKMLRS